MSVTVSTKKASASELRAAAELADGVTKRDMAKARQPIIYVAGPYRASSPWLVEKNIRAAEEWALAVACAGAIPLCPHSMFRFFDKSLDDTFWLNGTAELLRKCDAIVLIPGWRESKGSMAEHVIAKTRDIPIFDAHDPPVKSYGTDADRLRRWIETKVMRG